MTYRCGIGLGMERAGFTPGPPMVLCDSPGCDERIVLDGDIAPRWFIAGKAKRGWRLERTEYNDGSVRRRDWCPKHKGER
jgi:hypothetical protein